MGKSNKKRKNGTTASAKPQASFANLVAEATDKALKQTIGQEIQRLGFQLAQNQSREMAGIVTRLTAIEQLVCENFNISDTDLAGRVADIEDKALGYETGDIVEDNDLVRITVQTKKTDKDKYGDASKIQVSQVNGKNRTLPEELETALLGLKVGQSVEKVFGKNQDHKAKMTVDRISRKIITEEVNEESESTKE